MRALYAGIDVQLSRPCPIAVLDAEGRVQGSGWLEGADDHEVARAAADFITRFAPVRLAVGIDAPRQPRTTERMHYWETKRRSWRLAKRADVGWGRHCEVVLAAHRLATPQWTPLGMDAPPWMLRGFELFKALTRVADTYEVFPTASYRQLWASGTRIELELGTLCPGPKDMLDAYIAAFTVGEFLAGRGVEVGGQDGLGSIVLPRPLGRPISGVLSWPTAYPGIEG